MGVDIGALFRWEKISFDDLQNRIIALDAHNILYQFITGIRQRDGTPLKNSKGEITSHLSGLFHRTANLIESGIKPVYVFDGKPHSLKAKTLEERRRRKELAQKEWEEAIKSGDLAKARSKAQQTSRLTDEMIQQSKELLDALGVPFVLAPGEGESQACVMVKRGDAYAVASQDYDCLLVGTPLLIRNLTSSGRRKLPGKEAYVKVSPMQIRLEINLKNLGISQEQLVDMAILIGTDYNDGIKGIGPKKSLKLIKEHIKIEDVISSLNSEDIPSQKEIKEIRKIFLKPNVTSDYQLVWNAPDSEKVIKILCGEHHFTRERIEPVLKKYKNIDQIAKQKKLF